MKELIEQVVQWAEDRNLIEGSMPTRQIYKTMEEATELAVAIGRYDAESAYDEAELDEHKADIMDAIGDVTVTLIIIAAQLGMSYENCLQAAYDQIKHRKGKMVNGLFIKES